VANPEHVALIKQGVEAWTDWRRLHPADRIDLSGASLSNADLSTADFSGADLSHVDLSGADLSGVDLTSATLFRATLSGATLFDTDLTSANLTSATLSGATLFDTNLTGADLIATNFYSTNLFRTNFSGATFGWTILAEVDLSQAIGLDKDHHEAPSTIGLDTIYRSQGRIPESFLRGAGVPEPFITQMKALVHAMDPIQFYSCFISYSTKDQEFADRLHADLQAQGVRCWFAPHNMQGGRKLYDQIDEAIRVYDKLLLILSPTSIASDWVKTEITRARRREARENRRMLFPLRLTDYETLRDWPFPEAREICEYFIPDFSNWKNHDAYKLAFDRLLRDLKAEAAALETKP